MEQESPTRDPCFVVAVGFAFCNELADQFSRKEGRELAAERLDEHPMMIRLYPGGGDLRYAVESGWVHSTFEELMRLHVPKRIARWMRRSAPKPKTIATAEADRIHRQHRRTAVMRLSRDTYNAAIKAGKSHSEAVEAARTARAGL